MPKYQETTLVLPRDDFLAGIKAGDIHLEQGQPIRTFLNTVGRLPRVDGLALLHHQHPQTPDVLETIVFTNLVVGDETTAATIEEVIDADAQLSKELTPPTLSSVSFINTGPQRPLHAFAPDFKQGWGKRSNATLRAFFIFEP